MSDVRARVRSLSAWTGPRWLVSVLAAVLGVQLCTGLAAVRGLSATERANLRAQASVVAATKAATAGRPTTPDYSGGIDADPAAAADRTTDVRALLDRRAGALLHRDRATFLGTVDPRATLAFRTRQARLFDNLAEVPLGQWRYTLDETVEQPVTAERFARYHSAVWSPEVTLCYSLRDFDGTCTERPQALTFVLRNGGWYLGGDEDFVAMGGRTWRGLWDFGRVVAYQGRYSLLLAHPDAARRLPELADLVDDAVPHVSRVWGTDWPRRVVVVVPATQREMSQVIGDPRPLDDIAAVATADYTDAVTGQVRGQRVVINPANLDQLSLAGRLVVLRHEITHVASRAATGPELPTWLVEGLADYVGYLGSGVPVTLAAQELRTEIQRGEYPTALPSDADYRFDSPRLPQTYEESWLACRLIADLAGQDGLVRLYRQVGAARGGDRADVLGQAMRAVLSMGSAEFVTRWRSSVITELLER
ncbi:MAG TPA: hypothetical protein VLJ59_02790 [Mycobacteriales bacterium]|nr:hypothetical protein [Mycobacteriales bacterium]